MQVNSLGAVFRVPPLYDTLLFCISSSVISPSPSPACRADIQAHEGVYKELCSKCHELVGRGTHDGEELQLKLDNFQQRWNALR